MSVKLYLDDAFGRKNKLKKITHRYIVEFTRIPPGDVKNIKDRIEAMTNDVAAYINRHVSQPLRKKCIHTFVISFMKALNYYGNNQITTTLYADLSAEDAYHRSKDYLYDNINNKVNI